MNYYEAKFAREAKSNPTSDAVRAYLERGGEIIRVPGFEGVAPLPERRPKEPPVLPDPSPVVRKAEVSKEAASLTLEQISSRRLIPLSLLRKLDKAGHLPTPDAHGFNGKRRWSRQLTQEVVRIADEAVDAEEKKKSRAVLDRIKARKSC